MKKGILMNKIIYTSLFALLLSTNVFANDGGPKCNSDGNQAEINACAGDDYRAADKKLNETWKILITKEKANKAYIKSLRIAQKAWLKFRDLEVKAMFACDMDNNMRVCWGSMYPMLHQSAMTEITETRTKRLQQFIDKGQNPSTGERL
jgi:uncharacterized protein YecT (DUF1311 family)